MTMPQTPTVLFIVPSAYVLGGVQVWLAYLVDQLNEQGFRAICGVVDGAYHSSDHYLEHYSFENKVVIHNESGTRWGRVRAIADAIQSVNADIVLSVNIPDSYAGTEVARRQTKRDIKLLATLHALEPDYFADLEYSLPYIDGVLTTNGLTGVALQELTNVPPHKIHYAPYGVKLTPFDPTSVRNAGRAEASRPLTVLYSGRIENQQKRCRDLIAIATQLHSSMVPFKLLIAGDGEFRDELEQGLNKVLPAEQFALLGMVERDELLEVVLPSCDAMIITSAWETGPIVAWEAMAAGVTVVSSRYLGVEEEGALVDKQNCLLFDMGDVTAAAKALASLQSPEVRQQLNMAAHLLVEQRYTIDRSVEATADVIRSVLKQPPESRRRHSIFATWQKYGRIEQILGHQLGHWFRKRFNFRAKVTSPGSEWPHTLGYNTVSEQAFRQKLFELSEKTNTSKLNKPTKPVVTND